ncbi:MAG: hypothetical protein WAL85_15440 [Candidatus Korobacteraceae bacterium]
MKKRREELRVAGTTLRRLLGFRSGGQLPLWLVGGSCAEDGLAGSLAGPAVLPLGTSQEAIFT